MPRLEFGRLDEFLDWVRADEPLSLAVAIDLDLRGQADLFKDREVNGMLLLGCVVDSTLLADLNQRGALLFPKLPGIPYQAFRANLYTVEELFDPPTLLEKCRENLGNAYQETLDGRIYAHYCQCGRSRPDEILESLAQRLHDHSITDAIEALIKHRDVVGIMGGHSLGRNDPAYHRIAYLARTLAQEDFFLVSGGGPGAMEACHLGVHFVDRSTEELDTALAMLGEVPDFHQINDWLSTGLMVKEKFPAPDLERAESLGVPTWHFGHEPPNVFASRVAKYFSNSVREDGLVTIAENGLVFAEGSAGTIQEIFQDQTQNYYETDGIPSPMILLGEDYWKWRLPVYPLLCSMAVGRPYEKSLHITDSNQKILEILMSYRAATKAE